MSSPLSRRATLSGDTFPSRDWRASSATRQMLHAPPKRSESPKCPQALTRCVAAFVQAVVETAWSPPRKCATPTISTAKRVTPCQVNAWFRRASNSLHRAFPSLALCAPGTSPTAVKVPTPQTRLQTDFERVIGCYICLPFCCTGGVSCEDTCEFSGDGDCDDGGPGSDFDLCTIGTDCADCGPRGMFPIPTRSQVCGFTQIHLLLLCVGGGQECGNCFQSSTGAGCSVPDVENCVCDLDSFCCSKPPERLFCK